MHLSMLILSLITNISIKELTSHEEYLSFLKNEIVNYSSPAYIEGKGKSYKEKLQLTEKKMAHRNSSYSKAKTNSDC